MEPKDHKGKLFLTDYFKVILLAIKLFSYVKNYD
ncbi:hypothetical protein BH10BAC5_BH10BAC5_17260 [soil metagenome]